MNCFSRLGKASKTASVAVQEARPHVVKEGTQLSLYHGNVFPHRQLVSC